MVAHDGSKLYVLLVPASTELALTCTRASSRSKKERTETGDYVRSSPSRCSPPDQAREAGAPIGARITSRTMSELPGFSFLALTLSSLSPGLSLRNYETSQELETQEVSTTRNTA
ncbi:hypothetical protein ZHAS_00006723 [Anopheles sinensis]|uniref:Uncharacterized protein n=1 Tax=Anopheles sinensis TaxID=74873 RepID=A0A084VM20_ANOSI|nr:hypothetical protein ZHAS_00006723 [Anopheles sinensis]